MNIVSIEFPYTMNYSESIDYINNYKNIIEIEYINTISTGKKTRYLRNEGIVFSGTKDIINLDFNFSDSVMETYKNSIIDRIRFEKLKYISLI